MTLARVSVGDREKMVLAKHYTKKVFKEGQEHRCGPPMRAGAYEKWNWCAICTKIWDKERKFCPDCNQMLRWKARGNSNWSWKK